MELFELLQTQRDDINIISLTCTIKRQNRKIAVVFSVNFCFLMLSFWGFFILLFLICFFRHFATQISAEYQRVTSNQRDFKKKIMIIHIRGLSGKCGDNVYMA